MKISWCELIGGKTSGFSTFSESRVLVPLTHDMLFVACLMSSIMLVYPRDGSAQTIARAATLR